MVFYIFQKPKIRFLSRSLLLTVEAHMSSTHTLQPTHHFTIGPFVNRKRDQIGTAVELFAQYDEDSYRKCVEHIRKNNSGILSNDVIS